MIAVFSQFFLYMEWGELLLMQYYINIKCIFILKR